MMQVRIFQLLLLSMTCFFNIHSVLAGERIKVDLYGGIDWQNSKDDVIGQHVLNNIATITEDKITFSRISSSHARAWKHIKIDNNACFFNALKTPEREAISTYSHLPISVSPPLRFFTIKRSSFYSPFSFSQLSLPLHRHRIGVIENRHYGKDIDSFITNNPRYFYTKNSVDRSERLLGMLLKGRIDGFFDHGESVQKASKLYKEANRLVSVTIKGHDHYLPGYFACSNTPLGNQIIAIIDNAMSSLEFKKWIVDQHRGYFGTQEDSSLIPYLSQHIYN